MEVSETLLKGQFLENFDKMQDGLTEKFQVWGFTKYQTW